MIKIINTKFTMTTKIMTHFKIKIKINIDIKKLIINNLSSNNSKLNFLIKLKLIQDKIWTLMNMIVWLII